MILIADSGSTKTDWCLVENGENILRFQTRGTNPFFQTEEEILEEIETGLLPGLKGVEPSSVHFYGAGCAFPEKNEIIRRAVSRHLPVPVEVGSDLLAAARALCGDRPGIACILGTGSNSCQYDGKEIVKNVSPLGFILGDEGSGAVLGKLLIGDVLKDQLPPALKELFLSQYELTPASIMDRVYRQPFPNRFLAGFSPFILEHLDEIDQILNEYSRGWKTTRMNRVDLTALRLAVYEMKMDEEVPVGVAINEAVELAKLFGGEDSGSFVNGILGKIASGKKDSGEEHKKPRRQTHSAKIIIRSSKKDGKASKDQKNPERASEESTE